MYRLKHLHYNSQGLIQVAPQEDFRDLAQTFSFMREKLSQGSHLDQKMLAFFEREVNPIAALTDNFVYQGERGQRLLFAVGILKNTELAQPELQVRLGTDPRDEGRLYNTLDVLYLRQYPSGRMQEGFSYGFNKSCRGVVDESTLFQTDEGWEAYCLLPFITESIRHGKPLGGVNVKWMK